MEFTENGIKYNAEKGFCTAKRESDGVLIFHALDVWKDREPTKEDVLFLTKVITQK